MRIALALNGLRNAHDTVRISTPVPPTVCVSARTSAAASICARSCGAEVSGSMWIGFLRKSHQLVTCELAVRWEYYRTYMT